MTGKIIYLKKKPFKLGNPDLYTEFLSLGLLTL